MQNKARRMQSYIAMSDMQQIGGVPATRRLLASALP